MVTRAVLYARMACGSAPEGDRETDRQFQKCRKYTLKRGYTIVAEVSEDKRGASGIELDRPGLNRVLAMARAGEFDVLVVQEITRLARSLTGLMFVKRQLQQFGIEIKDALGHMQAPDEVLTTNEKLSITPKEKDHGNPQS